jgi:hypothetical protein
MAGAGFDARLRQVGEPASQAEREEVLDGVRELARDVKLKDLVIAHFIPPTYQEKIMAAAHWDDAEGAWSIAAMPLAGNPLRAQRELEAARASQIQATLSARAGEPIVPALSF